MNVPDHSSPRYDAAVLKQARRWLVLGVVALGVAGIFAGLLANSRSAYFYTALVVHVDLSVLVWFLTMACMFFTLAGKGRKWNLLADASFYCFAGGSLLIALSAFSGGEPYMSNYIPVIHHPMFFLALGLLVCGVSGTIVNLLFAGERQVRDVQTYGVVTAAWMMLIAIGCFVRSVQSLPPAMKGQVYYEYAFWGGGHVLQFVHTQLMMVAWLWLAVAAGLKLRLKDGHITGLYFIGLLAMFGAAFIYTAYPATSDEHRNAFTLLMRHSNGLAPLALGLFLLPALLGSSPARETMLAKVTLFVSLLLFAAGGMLGYLIAGSNVTVPAHYHGSIVGVTLAFMGVAYLLLPAFGCRDVSRNRLALWQPVVYGGGQLCWMAGMALLGSHGVARKTPGSADSYTAFASFLKHCGDGLALIGGLLFVWVVFKAFVTKERETRL